MSPKRRLLAQRRSVTYQKTTLVRLEVDLRAPSEFLCGQPAEFKATVSSLVLTQAHLLMPNDRFKHVCHKQHCLCVTKIVVTFKPPKCVNIAASLDDTLQSLVDRCRSTGGLCFLHLQGKRRRHRFLRNIGVLCIYQTARTHISCCVSLRVHLQMAHGFTNQDTNVRVSGRSLNTPNALPPAHGHADLLCMLTLKTTVVTTRTT